MPSSTPRRRGTLTRAVTLVALAVSIAAIGIVAPVPLGADSAHAATARATRVSSTTFRPGVALRLSASVASSTRTRTVAAQQLVGTTWRTITKATLPPGGTTAVARAVPTGRSAQLRLVVTAPLLASVRTTPVTVTQRPANVSVVAPAVFTPREASTITGKVAGVPRATVVLQRRTGSAWTNVASARATSTGAYTLRYSARTARATDRLRVVMPTTRQLLRATSRVVVVQPRGATSVTAKASVTTFVSGDSVRISGTTSRPAGTTVVLQRYDAQGRTWKGVATTKKSSTGYSFTAVATGTSDVRYRVVSPTTSTSDRAEANVTFKHRACSAARKPTVPYEVWFNDAEARDGTEISGRLVGLICAAAPGSSIHVTLYFSSAFSPEASAVAGALRQVALERGVHVNVLLDRSVTEQATLDYYKRFARVVTCLNGCMYQGESAAVTHDKVLALSDVSWSAAPEPVVVLSSGNWTARQFREYWQSATAFYGDSDLYRDHVARWNRQATCGSGAGQGSVAAACAKIPLAGWVLSKYGAWGLAGDPVFRSSRTPGLTYQFFPSTSGSDVVAQRLSRVTCRPGAGGHVNVAMYYVSPSRVEAITRQLARLRGEGCSVEVVISQGGGTVTPQPTVERMRELGISPRCTDLMHMKFTVVRNVWDGGEGPETFVMDGSQNWSLDGLRMSDESTFELSTRSLGEGDRGRVTGVAAKYMSAWTRVRAASRACDVS